MDFGPIFRQTHIESIWMIILVSFQNGSPSGYGLLGQPLITGQKRQFSAGYGHHDILGFMATNLNAIYQRTRTILSPKSISLRLLPVTNWPCLILRIDLLEQTRPSDRVGAKQQTCSGIHRIFTYLSYVRCVDASYLPSYKFYIALEHGPLIHLIQ